MINRSKHWNYFLAVEEDLHRCSRYVSFTDDNLECYSDEFAKLIVLAGSEVGSVLEEICGLIAPGSKVGTLSEYYKELSKLYPNVSKVEVSLPRFGMNVSPWKGWGLSGSPDWWRRSYNKLKHVRHAEYKRGTLRAAIEAVAAQFIVIQIYHKEKFGDWLEIPFSEQNLIMAPRMPDGFMGGATWCFGDPFNAIEK